MKIPDITEQVLLTAFSSTKQQILVILKREREIDLTGLAIELKITKMGVLNHVKDLEEKGIIERIQKREGAVGRPRLYIRLSPNSSNLFPKAYASITCSMLEFIEEKMGRNSVRDALKRRQNKIYDDYKITMEGKTLTEKVKALADLRNLDGYMVELKMMPGRRNFELLEYNCPILSVAEDYPESCMLEQELFVEVLGTKVSTSHRIVAGDNVCRFLISKNDLL